MTTNPIGSPLVVLIWKTSHHHRLHLVHVHSDLVRSNPRLLTAGDWAILRTTRLHILSSIGKTKRTGQGGMRGAQESRSRFLQVRSAARVTAINAEIQIMIAFTSRILLADLGKTKLECFLKALRWIR